MLKKAGIVVLGATAGMISLAPLASAGEAHDDDHDHRGHSHSSSDCGASAVQRGQLNTGDQGLLGINNTNIQAPINQLGVLSAYDNDGCDGDDDERGGRGGRGGHGHGHGGRDDNDGGGASAEQRGQLNTGDQLIGINNTNIQAPINQLGILSAYDN
ncbi:hypothetical protein [Actinomycetospora cinnamomea]|uniref:Small secreted domain DUF320 n=1 Tax=Actinomycetospora cinnamomea TaxID=663609 RepID=A0A2U1F931_9PSEU|nr:hypothetical protein [Actinomycetospora cinnamomea]PVZ08649.1 hypothetical protein C8D89_108246 [Actinomycetospora cinnamomea]